MQTFLAIYRGKTIGQAKIIDVVSEPSLITAFVQLVLLYTEKTEEDPVLRALENGRTQALENIAKPAVSPAGRQSLKR